MVTINSCDSSPILIQTQIASSSASIQFTSIGTYQYYLFKFDGVLPATNAVNLYLLVSTNGGTSYLTSGYVSTMTTLDLTTSGGGPIAAITNGIYAASSVSNSTGLTSGSIYYFPASGNANLMTTFVLTSTGHYTNGTGGANVGVTGVNAFQFIMSSGNITSGTFSLYGYNS